MLASKIGSYFEEFSEGEIYYHAISKTILESDNNIFCLLTMNHHPVHLDQEYAKKQQHGKILVVGTLIFSIAVGITVPDISGKAIANLGYDRIEHLAPVFIGDTIHVISKILSKRESSTKNDRGIIILESTIYNQDQVAVLRFRRSVLIKKRGDGE